MTTDKSGVVIKEIKSKRDLADYLTSLTGDDVSHHAALAHYVGSDGHGRAEVFQALNCATRSKPALLAEFQREQERKPRRGKGRSVYHIMISRRGRTDPQILASMARRLLQLAGLDKQKALIAVHSDTDDNHVHIAVSALDASGRQIILERGYTKVLLAHINAQLCHEFGFVPEAGLGFHATNEGVFRTADGAKLRDADFHKVTKDLRKEPALTARSASFEHETGLPSAQRRIRESFNKALRAETLELFAGNLAADRISYQLGGSGATITLDGDRFKASDIARSASPKNIAKRFGVTHLTQTEAEQLGLATGVGFYRKDEADAFQLVRLAKAFVHRADPLVPMPGAEKRWMQHTADQRLEQNLPKPAPTHADPLRDRIRHLRDRPTPARLWQAERLERALRYCQGVRGRPPRTPAIVHDRKLPEVKLKRDTAILVGPEHHTRWNGPPIWGDVRPSKAGPLWHVTRNSQPVATFGPGMIVVHQATPADKEHIVRLAQLDFGGDVQAHCKPADRRSWIRAAQACDVVLGNPELVPAQAGLATLRHNRLARLTTRLAATGNGLLDAGRQALGEAHAALQSAFPSIQRDYARRARSLQLSTRLSVVHERIAAEKELARLELDQARAVTIEPQSAVNRPDAAPDRAPPPIATISPPLASAQVPTQRYSEIGEDGMIRYIWDDWLLPTDPATVASDVVSHEHSPGVERHKTSASPQGRVDEAWSDRSAEGVQRQPAEQETAPTASPPTLPANHVAPDPEPTPASTPIAFATKFEKAIHLVSQLDAMAQVEDNWFRFRSIGDDSWKTVAIPEGSRTLAEDAQNNFLHRVNAVQDALVRGAVTVDENGRVKAVTPDGDAALFDLRKLLREPSMLEIARAAAGDGAAKRRDAPEPLPAKQPEAPAVSPSAQTAHALHAALRRVMRERILETRSPELSSRENSGARQIENDLTGFGDDEAKRFTRPIVASDTSSSGGGLGFSPSNDTPVNKFKVIEKMELPHWRTDNRYVGPLERIEWLFKSQCLNDRKRLVLRRGNKLTLPRDLLERVELSQDDLADSLVQARLRTEHDEQVNALSPMVKYLSALTDVMVRDDHHWWAFSYCDKLVANELSAWRDEPLVQSALDTFGRLPKTEPGGEECIRRHDAFLGTLYPEQKISLPPVEDTSGATGTVRDISRPTALCEERDEARVPADRSSHTSGFRPPGDDGTGW